MWYDAQRTGIETVKAVFSVAVLWGGMFVSGAADQADLEPFGTGSADDIVGVWEWVADASHSRSETAHSRTSLLEIRREVDGELSARVLLDQDGQAIVRRVRGVSFEHGKLCLEIDSRAAFKGRLRDDGRSIDGKVLLEGRKPSSAELWKVEARTDSHGGIMSLRAT
jgi:formylglycine-generating enzyme required for sulfatase activity